MLPRILVALLLSAGPALAQGSGSQGAGTTGSSTPSAVPGTGDAATVPGVSGERGSGGPGNTGSAAAPGTTRSGGGTGQLPSKDVTTSGSAATNR